jgi:hypothetical protein
MGFLDNLIRTGQRTGWSVAGMAGGEVSAGTPAAKLSASVNYLRMPLKHGGKVIMYQGYGGGVGLSVGLLNPPVSVTGSTDSMPATGGNIIRGPACPKAVSMDTFSGLALFASASINTSMSSTGTIILFLDKLPSTPAPLAAMELLLRTKAFAWAAGVSFTSAFGSFGTSAVLFSIGPTKKDA